MSAKVVPRNSTARTGITIHSASGQLTDPDGSPAIEINSVQLNGSPTTLINPTINQLEFIITSPNVPQVGYYEMSFSTGYTGVATGDLIAVKFSAVVKGITVIGFSEFIIDQAERKPFIDVS